MCKQCDQRFWAGCESWRRHTSKLSIEEPGIRLKPSKVQHIREPTCDCRVLKVRATLTPVCLVDGDTGCVPRIAEDQVGEVSMNQVTMCPGVTLRHSDLIFRKYRRTGGFSGMM